MKMKMKPTPLLQDEEDAMMHIELQATDSNGSSKDDYEEEDYKYEYEYEYAADIEGQPPILFPQSALVKESSSSSSSSPLQEVLRLLSFRKVVSLLLGVTPICVFALEMIPERCHVCLDGVELDTYFFAAAVCGGVAAVSYGDGSTYLLARLLGGAISALGALFMIWLVLVSSSNTNDGAVVAFLLFGFVGILGAMPGVGAYFVIRILSDLCYVSDIHDFDEFAPLTKLITISSAD
jgi:hypothetical protein